MRSDSNKAALEQLMRIIFGKLTPRNAFIVSYNTRRHSRDLKLGTLNVKPTGKVPEWLNGTVSKTVVGLVSTEGSNPSLPAKESASERTRF